MDIKKKIELLQISGIILMLVGIVAMAIGLIFNM
jgi:hypothetical protein